MKKLSLFLTLAAFVILTSCSKDEKVINAPVIPWNSLTASDATPSVLAKIEQPSGTVVDGNIYSSSNNGRQLPGKVERIAENGDYIYLFMPSVYKIEVISNSNFKSIGVIDFTATGRKPAGICFPNPTDAYITFSNDSTVDLLDTKYMTVARTLKTGKKPTSVSASGNQVFVTNSADNTVSVIDTRYPENGVSQTIPVATAPYYADNLKDGTYMLIVSLGGGKIDSLPKSAATLTMINISTKAIFKTKSIGTSATDAISEIPRGITVSDKGWAFVPTQTALFRINVKTGDLSAVAKGDFLSAVYNYKRDELIVMKKTSTGVDAYTADPSTGALKSAIELPYAILALLPLTY